MLSTTDAAGQTTHYEYDKLNRQTKIIHPDNSFTQIEYDAAGHVIAQIDEAGNRTEFQYDKASRRIQTKNALGQLTTFVYDKNGNIVSETDANNHTISYQYDILDRRVKTTYPNNLVKEDIYDLGGHLVAEKDLAGRETQYQYDEVGRLTSVIKFLNDQKIQTRFAYDEVGNQVSQTDANQHTTTWTYDKLGRVLSRTLPLLMTEQFVYAPKTGNLISHTDFNQQTTSFTYDPNSDRLVSTKYADRRVESFTYNKVSNRQTMTDPSGTTTYSYDNRHRLIKEVKPNQAILEYGYDKVGNRTLLKFTPPTGAAAQVKYQYDSLNRLTSLETRKPDNSLFASYQYTLLPTGHRSQIIENTGRIINYSYDDLYRLTKEKVTQNNYVTGFSYQYDAVGNRIYETQFDGPTQVQTKYTFDANDRLLKQGGVEYEYDDNGNTTRIAIDNNVMHYGYNSDNRLIEVIIEENGQATSTVTYAYDGDNNRIQTNADGKITQYVVDNNNSLSQVIAELDQNGQINVAYLHGDDLISQYRGNDIRYYHYDGLGSTRTLTAPNATVTDTYYFNAFGELQEQTGETENNYLYTGEQIDPNTGNYYLRAWYYSPATGGFLSMDSFDGIPQYPVTLHKYLYANVDPVNYTDPKGNLSLGSLSMGSTINGMLTTMNIAETGLSLFHLAIGEKELSAKEAGIAVLLSLTPKLGKFVFKKWVTCNSFTAGTLVHTENGKLPIEQVEIGTRVWSFNEKTGDKELKTVTHIIINEKNYDIYLLEFEEKDILEVTSEHPVYVENKGWELARDLTTGVLVKAFEESSKLTKIKVEKRYTRVYNLTIEGNHNFYVGDLGELVHNMEVDVCILPLSSAISMGKNFKDHFLRKKALLKTITGKNYTKLNIHGQEFLDDLKDLVDSGRLKFVGKGTLKKGENEVNIYKGEGVTLVLKDNNEFVTLLKSGEGMDLGIMFTTKW